VDDQFTVPLCRIHHRELHRHEVAWWAAAKMEPLPIARSLWERTRNGRAHKPAHEGEPTIYPSSASMTSTNPSRDEIVPRSKPIGDALDTRDGIAEDILLQIAHLADYFDHRPDSIIAELDARHMCGHGPSALLRPGKIERKNLGITKIWA
jgi:hypothetical protein